MSFLSGLLQGVVSGGVQSAANYQSRQQAAANAGKKRNKDTCTPCAAGAAVDAERKRLGYKVK